LIFPRKKPFDPDGTGAFKTDRKLSVSRAAVGTPRFIRLPRMLEQFNFRALAGQ
jgi:hypothetical protein